MKQPEILSVEDYLEGEEYSNMKHEFLGGVVHAMSGATNGHNRIVFSAMLSLGNQLRGKSCEPFNSDTKLKVALSDHVRFYYPDAMVVCQKSLDMDLFQTQPVVVIEVLSKSTRRVDMGEKKDAYLTIPSLKILMLVEAEKVEVTVYRRNAEGGFRAELYEGQEEVILLPEIEAEISLAEIYERVEFGN